MIAPENLRGLPGLRREARAALLAEQPRTVRDALAIPGVGRKTTRALLLAGVITDEGGAQGG